MIAPYQKEQALSEVWEPKIWASEARPLACMAWGISSPTETTDRLPAEALCTKHPSMEAYSYSKGSLSPAKEINMGSM